LEGPEGPDGLEGPVGAGPEGADKLVDTSIGVDVVTGPAGWVVAGADGALVVVQTEV